jgi:hypothetical protein
MHATAKKDIGLPPKKPFRAELSPRLQAGSLPPQAANGIRDIDTRHDPRRHGCHVTSVDTLRADRSRRLRAAPMLADLM